MTFPDSVRPVHSYHRPSRSNLSRRVRSHPKLHQLYPSIPLPFSPLSSPNSSVHTSPSSSPVHTTHILIEPEFPPPDPAKTTTLSPSPPPPPPPHPSSEEGNGACRDSYSMEGLEVAELLRDINYQLQEVRFGQACLTDEVRASDQQSRRLSDLETALGEKIGQVKYMVNDHMEGNFIDSEHIYRRIQKSEKKLLAQLMDVRMTIEAIQEQQRNMLDDDNDAEIAAWASLSSRSPRPFGRPTTPPSDDETPNAFTVEDVLEMINNVDSVVQCFLAQKSPSDNAPPVTGREIRKLRETMNRASLTWLNMTGLSLEDGTRGSPFAPRSKASQKSFKDDSLSTALRDMSRASQSSIGAPALARKVSFRPSLRFSREVGPFDEHQSVSESAPVSVSSPFEHTFQATMAAVPSAARVATKSDVSSTQDDSDDEKGTSVIRIFTYTSAPPTLTNLTAAPAFPRVPEPAAPGTPDEVAYPRLSDMEYESMELDEYQQTVDPDHDPMPDVAPTPPMTYLPPPIKQPQLDTTLRLPGLSKRKSAVLVGNDDAATEWRPESPTKKSRVGSTSLTHDEPTVEQSWYGRGDADVRNMLGVSGGIDGAGLPPVAAISPARRRIKNFRSRLGLGGSKKTK
ncbi:hypothetical protein L202_00652 [Cryptococcus amylolentus CBS 6039]|uniref:Uncharacterized protein n=1 Tax=Cryptococcus amylolentus CBS 6039 TaxID=1295533 RepID=A0A1E3I833_9TREE|nr:hypothetical protein L202_00652 [Cryptococcus amylolentus CBS 6039]ODN84780.1 hypothetical protein L202_00652 [Cryptococcus amylolentus CBS 6039]